MAGAPAHLPLLRRRSPEQSPSTAPPGAPSTPCSPTTGFPMCIARSPCGSVSPDGWDCYGNERQAFSEQIRFFNNSLLSDVRLKVGKSKFFAHRLILVRASDVFERMLASDWHDASKEEVELFEDESCAVVFNAFLKFIYGCHVMLNASNTLPLLMLADKYNVCDLRCVCTRFACTHIIPKLQLKDVFHIWFQYATKCCHHQLVGASVAALADKMDEIAQTTEWEPEWTCMERDQLAELLRSSDLVIGSELELWRAVNQWLITPDRASALEDNLHYLLPYMRFPLMSSDQLQEVEHGQLAEQFPEMFTPLLLEAYKYQSMSLAMRAASRDFYSLPYLLRNYSELRWDKRLIISKYTSCARCSEVSLRFSTRASASPPQTWDWELKVYPKGIAVAPSELKCVLSASAILDQPRAVEFSLAIVDDVRVVCCVSGLKNFAKNRYTADTEIGKKISVEELCASDSPFLINDNLILQIALKPIY